MEIVAHWTSHQNGFAHLAIGLSDVGDELSLRLLRWAHNKRENETKQSNDKLSAPANGLFLAMSWDQSRRSKEDAAGIPPLKVCKPLKRSFEPCWEPHLLFPGLVAYLIFKFLVLKPELFSLPLAVFPMHLLSRKFVAHIIYFSILFASSFKPLTWPALTWFSLRLVLPTRQLAALGLYYAPDVLVVNLTCFWSPKMLLPINELFRWWILGSYWWWRCSAW